MTGLLAAVRLGSAGRLDYPPHMGCHKSQFFDGMICSKIRDVQILIFVVGREPLSPERIPVVIGVGTPRMTINRQPVIVVVVKQASEASFC
jgi:hypothetical protein